MVGEFPEVLGSYKGLRCHHWDEELPLIAAVLAEVRPALVVETGTMYGGFAAFLADAVAPWGGEVFTVDRRIYPGLEEACAGRDNLQFLRADLADLTTQWIIRQYVFDVESRRSSGRPMPTLLYCDGPPGRPEVEWLGDAVDILGVHDYGTDADSEALAWFVTLHQFEPLHEAAFAALQAEKTYFTSRFWRRRP